MKIEKFIRAVSYILMAVCVVLMIVDADNAKWYIAEFGIFSLFCCGSYNRSSVRSLSERIKELEDGR